MLKPSAKEERQDSDRRTVGSAVWRRGRFPRALERLPVHRELVFPAFDDPPTHRGLRLPKKERACAELIMMGSKGFRGHGREPRIECRHPGRRDLVRRSPRICPGGIRRGSHETLVRETSEFAVHVTDADVESDSRLDRLHSRVPMTWTVVPQ